MDGEVVSVIRVTARQEELVLRAVMLWTRWTVLARPLDEASRDNSYAALRCDVTGDGVHAAEATAHPGTAVGRGQRGGVMCSAHHRLARAGPRVSRPRRVSARRVSMRARRALAVAVLLVVPTACGSGASKSDRAVCRALRSVIAAGDVSRLQEAQTEEHLSLLAEQADDRQIGDAADLVASLARAGRATTDPRFGPAVRTLERRCKAIGEPVS